MQDLGGGVCDSVRDMGVGVGGRGEGVGEGEEMVWGREQRKRLSCEGELRNGTSWVSLAGASSLRALGSAERSSEWAKDRVRMTLRRRRAIITRDINEKPLHFNDPRDRMVNRGRQEQSRHPTSRT